ncbi:MAG: flavodoxin [Treponema sp.]|jgi:flavodoxin|nr:flavodoxin [Treponema sp.]
MKTLVVFYSYDGNSALVAEELKRALGSAPGKALGEGCDTLEIKTQDEAKRSGFAKFLWGGRMVLTHKNPRLMPWHAELDGYDLIILGGPVWAGAPAPALQAFIAEAKLQGKRIGLFLCHAGGPGKALDKLKALLAGNEIAGSIDFQNPGKQDRAAAAERVDGWVKALQG